MKVSNRALLRTLKLIVDECEYGGSHHELSMSEPIESIADRWMSLWHIRIATGYSTEYARQIVRSLYWDHRALQRQKGAKFLYRHSAKAQEVIAKLETVV